MIVQTFRSAQIVIVLASNDFGQIAQLRHDLLTSKIKYHLVILLDQARLVDDASYQISIAGGIAPVVFVIDYEFAGTDCEVLLRATKSASFAATIASVVINPPLECARRQSLTEGGARLFDGQSVETSEHLTLQ